MNFIEFYTSRKQHYQALHRNLNTQIFWLGWARLLTFLSFGGSIFLFFRLGYQYAWLVIAFILLILFLWLVKRHIKFFDERELKRNLIRINENELQVLQHQPSFLNDGTRFHSDESYLLDLDVFGSRSIFHLLNRAATELGEKRLANLLQNPLKNIQIIKNQQLAVAELAEQIEFRQAFLAQALRTRSNAPDYAQLLAWVESSPELYQQRFIRVARILMPALFFLGLILGIAFQNISIITFFFFLNFALPGIFAFKIKNIHAAISRNVESLGVFAELFNLINKNSFQSEILQKAYHNTKEAHRELKKLDTIARFFDQRLNAIVYILLTGAIMYDIQCVLWLEKWKLRNKDHLRKWLDAIAEMEMLNSLATFQFNHPEYIVPNLIENQPFIEAKDLAHPLIPAQECVSNDFSIGKGKRLYIVTGSNMSGKSTFLRTVGVNVLLARCGAPVCATYFECSPLEIHSSLRQSDSLQDHVSTFYAELRRLQEILQALEKDSKALVLLDEVLRGTNSDDKLYGSQELVKRLVDLGCIGLLATHDIELSKMEQDFPSELGNLCFESVIENGDLHFDYKLKSGTAKNRNATFLMQKMKIIG
ncbi:MAG: hypothetical protein IPJ74_21880 [Saprospiraceae bacterium]|nr:hypothetical protein [Saprospiraceae bacterium]